MENSKKSFNIKSLVLKSFIFLIIIILALLGFNFNKKEKGLGKFVEAGKLNQKRSRHTATLLKSGNILVTGGYYKWDTFSSAELYLSEQKKFINVGNMNEKREDHNAVLLKDGRVAIFGGPGDVHNPKDSSNLLEIYNPKTRKFKPAYKLKQTYLYPTSVLLKDGRVFIYGGENKKGLESGYVEIYDPKTNTSKLTSRINYARGSFTLTKLKDGRVLITGGKVSPYTGGKLNHTLPKKMPKKNIPLIHPTNKAEIYDPKTDKFTLVSDMNYKRSSHGAVLLPDGKVLIAGGHGYNNEFLEREVYEKNIHKNVKRSFSYRDLSDDIQYIELFFPKTNKFKVVGKLRYAIGDIKLIPINDKYIFIAGGCGKYQEIIDITNFKTYRTSKMLIRRRGAPCKLKDNPKILITGGHWYGRTTDIAEMFILNKKGVVGE